jgi:large subunit ribosomal protein L29
MSKEKETKKKKQGKRAEALDRLRGLSKDELQTEARNFRQELFNLRLRQQTGAVEKPSRIKDLRKGIARIETILNQSKVGVK